ncbi:MAG: hypothetical protein PVF27_06055 [Gemmatimonadales bacterium]
MTPDVRIALPSWVEDVVEWERRYATVEDRVHLAVALSRENVERGTGGPFGAAVFALESGSLVGVGVNLVVTRRSSVLHAEIVALMTSQARLGRYSLRGGDAPAHEIVTSCDPCAMCLGAILWSGVRRMVCGADREDARDVGFDEGPVFAESWAYVERKGVEVVRGVLRDEAAAVLRLYGERGGEIYNA